jgi:hypothetical protein
MSGATNGMMPAARRPASIGRWIRRGRNILILGV